MRKRVEGKGRGVEGRGWRKEVWGLGERIKDKERVEERGD